MPTRLDPPALPDWEPAFAAVRVQAERQGLRALVVGGYVRDRLLGDDRADAIREVDILVEGQGAIQLATAVSAALKRHPPVIFERFGTAHLDLDDRHALEFVSSRVERYDPASRKPEVSPGTLKDDVMRRDFTINTLLMEWDGTVLDLTGRGLSDLNARRIVTPLEPQTTFDEDPLRMLRAVRFATTLEFTLDPSVEGAIRDQSGRLQPPTVSMERIRDEFSKLLLAERVQSGLELLDATRLLPRILPQLEAGKGMQQGGWHSHDVFGHALLAASLAPAELVTRLAALLHDVGKPAVHDLREGKPTFIGHQDVGATMAGTALRQLRYPGEVIEAVTKLIRLHMRPIQYDPQGWEDKAVRRLVRDAGEQLDRLLALARADMRASHYPDVKKIDDLEARIRRLDADAIAAIRSPLTGEELMARTGRPAGPWIKRVKSALEDAIVDGTLPPDAGRVAVSRGTPRAASPVTAVRRWPWPFLLLLAGAVLATARVVPAFTVSPTLVLAVFLPPLLFDAGFSMRSAALRRELSWILLLGLVGAVLTAAVVYGLLLAAGLPSDEALLLAAILAATDPVSVFAVLRRLRTPERLRVALEGESLVNDGVAVVLFVVALAVVQRRVLDTPGVLGLFVWLTVGGVAVGAGLGLLTRRFLGAVPHPVQIGVTVIAAYAGYLLADWIGASGLLAVITMSLILGNAYEPSTHHQVHRFWRQLGFVMSSVVFLLVGLQVRLDEVGRVGGRLLLLVGVVLLARALMVTAVTLARSDLWPWSWRLALVWAGLRGALSLALALGVPATVAAHDEILVLVFGFVFLSLVVQGLSTGPVFQLLGISRQTAVTTVP